MEVVEIAPGLRSGGQTVDLRGAAAEVLAELGVLERCRARLVPQRGIAWVDASGAQLAQMGVEAFGGRGFVSREELLRTDLAEEIHDAVDDTVRYRFGDTVRMLAQLQTGVEVLFESGDRKVFDVVIGADGTHSRVRALLFGPEEQFRRPLGLGIAWFTVPEQTGTPPLDGWFQVHNAPGSLVVGARPGHPGQQEIGFTFPARELPDRHDRPAQLALLDELFCGVGWRAGELLAAARRAEDLALDTCDQIHLDRWSTGRVVLLGDSAWCASPLSGLGTALALRGASLLAAALGDGTASPDSAELLRALDRYETDMRPHVIAAQKLPPGRVRLHAPRTRLGIRAAAIVMRVVQTRAVAVVLDVLLRTASSPHARGPALRKSVG